MKRLTKWVDGVARENHDNETRETENKNGNRACTTKLSEYENIGKTPQEVAEWIKYADYKFSVAEGLKREISDKLDAIINTAESAAHAIGSKLAKDLILMRNKGEIK